MPKFVDPIFYNAHASPTKKSIYSKEIIEIFTLKNKEFALMHLTKGMLQSKAQISLPIHIIKINFAQHKLGYHHTNF
jgi:hypothetical protein